MRIPAIENTWYPASRDVAERAVSSWTKAAATTSHHLPAALIVPHAGWAYSGRLSAAAFATLPADACDRVIILAPSHHTAMPGRVSPEPAGDVRTPFGPLTIGRDLHDALASLPYASFFPEAHAPEHAIDIQLPFIRKFLPECEVGALLVGQWDAATTDDAKMLTVFAAAFRRLLTPRTLVVISTDFTHHGRAFGYLPFGDRAPEHLPELDANLYAALASNDNGVWASAIHAVSATVCGASCLHLLLASLPPDAVFSEPSYDTSFTIDGGRDRCVGYLSASIDTDWSSPPKPTIHAMADTCPCPADDTGAMRFDGIFTDSPAQATGEVLLELARASILHAVIGDDGASFVDDTILHGGTNDELFRHQGAFVTLTINGSLRGCIGEIMPTRPVLHAVCDRAADAATKDPRFPPVCPEELDKLDIEVSVLSKPMRIKGPQDIVVGRDGIIMEQGGRLAVFLPQVAVEQGWDVPTMLGQLSLKAGLDKNAWKSGAKFMTFRTTRFKGPFHNNANPTMQRRIK